VRRLWRIAGSVTEWTGRSTWAIGLSLSASRRGRERLAVRPAARGKGISWCDYTRVSIVQISANALFQLPLRFQGGKTALHKTKATNRPGRGSGPITQSRGYLSQFVSGRPE
jgi:hypothetical protein